MMAKNSVPEDQLDPQLEARESKHVEENENEDRARIRSLALSSKFDPQVRRTVEIELLKMPDKETFFRIAKGDHWRIPAVGVVNLAKKDGFGQEIYLVTEEFMDVVGLQVSVAILLTGQYTTGKLFLWPVRLEAADGRPSEWYSSAQEAAQVAETSWVRVYSGSGKYMYVVAPDNVHPEPKWPANKDVFDLAIHATKNRVINRHDHEVLRRLRGEI